MWNGKCFLHVDMDAFFASVEQLDHPEWKGKPVIVGGLPGERRSVVSTASYEARKFGVHSAMPVFQAVKLCPQGIYTHGNYKRYSEISCQIMNILSDYSPDVNQLSIDEASVEITGTEQLFGPPLTLAETVKNRIFQETGLTVSCGIASTAYLAKLSSEVNKPNGLFQIDEGKEEEFMLQLPLKKVWGIGEKTLERLNKAGFYTTKDIHEKPLDLLTIIFGRNMASFLYNTVRGIEPEPAKQSSHSISAETTFEYDLKDQYSAETALLSLCHTVMFRLLKEKSYSRTAMVKIRYDDFSTCTVQSTDEEYITSVDDLYQRITRLFEGKYENGRGIRLLGVGVEKVETQDQAVLQETLFDFGEKKKQAVEKSILNLSNKHPEIKVQKARLLKSLLIFLGLSALFSGKNSISAQTVHENNSENAAGISLPQDMVMLPVPEEAPKTLFDYKKNDSHIEFSAEGWWQGNFSGGFSTSFNTDGTVSLSGISPVFTQKVDLSASFLLNSQYFFETSFADEFTRNLISAGFRGKDSNPLKELKIANRGITVPDTYSASFFNQSAAGGNNQAPGISASFRDPSKGKWNADVILRYDMTEEKTATYYGHNSVDFTEIPVTRWLSGQLYALPAELLEKINSIYVENSSGEYSDKNGRKFRRLSSADFITEKSSLRLILSKDAGAEEKNGKLPAVIVTFNENPDFALCLGNYSTSGTFLGDIQTLFGKYSLSEYSINFETEFAGQKALVLQSGAGFSPFIFASCYDCGIISNAEIYFGNKETRSTSDKYQAVAALDLTSPADLEYFNEKHMLATLSIKDLQPSLAQKQFPLAEDFPLIYLTKNDSVSQTIVVESYTKASSYYIGTDASAGSVRVYKNGILDSGAVFDSETGEITVSGTVSNSDKIYITWQEDSNSLSSGRLTFQSGFNWNFTDNLSADISAQTSWPLSSDVKYAEYNKSNSGFASVTSQLAYSSEYVKLKNGISAGYSNTNTTGIYRILGFEEEAASTVYMSKYSGYFPSENQIPVIGESLSGENKASSSITGLQDEKICGYKIPFEWNFLENEENQWAAINFSIQDGSKLCNADSFELALKPATVDFPENCRIYLQLGISADSSEAVEYPENVPFWEITSKLDMTSSQWQTVTVNISNQQKARLAQFHDGRIIALKKDNSDKKETGLIYVGPHQINEKGIYFWSDSAETSSFQKKDNSIPQKESFNKSDNFIQQLNWTDFSMETDSDRLKLNGTANFNPVDLSSYESLKFYFKYSGLKASEKICSDYQTSPALTFILDSDSINPDKEGNIAVKASIYSQALNTVQNSENWHVAEINLKNPSISIDGNTIPAAQSELEIHRNRKPLRMKVSFLPVRAADGTIYKSGSVAIDELHLKGTEGFFLFQDKFSSTVKKEGVILKAKDYPLLSDGIIKIDGLASSSHNTESLTQTDSSLSGTIQSQITVTKLKLEFETDLSSENEKILSSASQQFSSASPLLGIFSLRDKFLYNPADSSFKKESVLTADLSRIKIPLKLSGSGSSSNTLISSVQEMNYTADLDLKLKNTGVIFNSKLDFNQHSPQENIFQDTDYFSTYVKSTENCFSTGNQSSLSREITGSAKLQFKFKPAQLSPSITFQMNEKYSSPAESITSDKSFLQAEIPFKINSNSFMVSYKKESGASIRNAENNNYAMDFTSYGQSFSSQSYFWTAPVYDIFSSQLSEQITNSLESLSASSMYYASAWDFSWKHSIYKNVKDIFIPASSTVSFVRNTQAASSYSDAYLLKISTLNTPINLFGTAGTCKLFNWYKTDEYSGSLTATVKIPVQDTAATEYAINTYGQASFFITDKNVLKAGAQLSLETSGEWELEGTLLYSRSSKTNLLLELTKLIMKESDFSSLKSTRSNSFNLQLNYSDLIFTQTYEINHTLSMELLKYVTLNLGMNAELTHKTNKAALLSIKGTIGGKVQF